MLFVDDSLSDILATSHPDTEAYRVYMSLRSDIRSGRIRPGVPLRTEWMKKTYGASTSPLREALARLAAEFYVTATGKRGYRVPGLSRSEFVSLFAFRNRLECDGLRASILARNDNWEGRMLLACHALKKVQVVDVSDLEATELRESRHRRFHLELISECGSPWLLRIFDLTSSHVERYRRIILRDAIIEPGYFDEIDEEHDRLMEIAFDGDVERAVAFLTAHHRRSFDQVLAVFDGEAPKIV